MNTSGQQAQPIPLFYGSPPTGASSQDLETGFDYVITSIVVSTPADWPESGLAIYDENGVPFFVVYLDGSAKQPSGVFAFSGEMPIGPRSALHFNATIDQMVLWIAGYALTPQSQLHE